MRNLAAVLAIAAIAGSGVTCISIDDELRVGGARDARRREAEEADRARRARQQEREAHRREAADREAEKARMLQEGLEPTTGRPLSRQRRRALARAAFKRLPRTA
jgi:hypothetical protein